MILQDLDSREQSLENREKRISEERELMEQRAAALSEDLHKAREELVSQLALFSAIFIFISVFCVLSY